MPWCWCPGHHRSGTECGGGVVYSARWPVPVSPPLSPPSHSHIVIIQPHNDFIATRNCRKNWVATWKCILSKRPNQYCLFYDFKRCVSSNLSIICIFVADRYWNFRWYYWKIGWYTPLIIIKQAILGWSFRQNIFPACFTVKMSNIGRAAIIVTAIKHLSYLLLFQF